MTSTDFKSAAAVGGGFDRPRLTGDPFPGRVATQSRWRHRALFFAPLRLFASSREPSNLYQLQARWDDQRARQRLEPLMQDLRRQARQDLRHGPLALLLAAAAALGLVVCASSARAASPEQERAAESFGPPAPVSAATPPKRPFQWPDRFTQQPDETLEQAQARVTRQRHCARDWWLVGTLGGTALDMVTTQANQKAGYRESNPLYGSHASLGEQLALHAASGAFSYWRIQRQARRFPAQACRTARIYAGAAFIPGLANLAVRVRF